MQSFIIFLYYYYRYEFFKADLKLRHDNTKNPIESSQTSNNFSFSNFPILQPPYEDC